MSDSLWNYYVIHECQPLAVKNWLSISNIEEKGGRVTFWSKNADYSTAKLHFNTSLSSLTSDFIHLFVDPNEKK